MSKKLPSETTRPRILELYEFDQFPTSLFRTKSNRHPPQYQFGMLLRPEKLMEYAAHHKLVRKDYKNSAAYGLCAMTRAIRRLEIVADTVLDHTRTDDRLGEEYIVLSLYSNYNINNRRLIKEDENDVIEIIQRELGITEPLKWYWDWKNVTS
ncbi:hypothetical protein C8R47DRAFT_1064693 [Mycena vitilis]|nr:hypothetical protein C8R47DRAFT_1064693 [Mycena vitilis]